MAALIPLFKEKQLKPVWKFDAGTLIWRLFFASHDLMVGETRNQETKSTRFFCIHLHSGKPLWQNIGFDEPWWIGIETVHEKWLILHGYVRPDMPEHRGIRVVDIESGKLLWKNDTLSFWFIENETLYAHKYIFEKHIGCELDIKTGSILDEQSDNLELMQVLRQKVLQKDSERHQDVIFPEVFDDHESDDPLRTAVRKVTESKALDGWIEYLSLRDILVISQYRQVQNQSESSMMNNVLSVYDMKSGKTLYNEIIAQGVKAPSPDSFFVRGDVLLFINHQTVLTALQPWKS
jgi:hypothetical protein